MSISSVYSLMETQYATEIDSTRRRRSSTTSETGSGDTVTFSEEAKALAAEMAARKVAEESGNSDSSFERNPGGDAAESEEGAEALAQGQASGGSGGSSSAGSIDAQIEKLAAQMQQLGQQMSAIMSGPGTQEAKVAQTAPIEQRINGLNQQIQELMAQKRAQENAGGQA